MKIRDYLYFKEEYGLICIDEKISEILPVADILSCTVSSVISWGELLGKPVVCVCYWTDIFDSYVPAFSTTLFTNSIDEYRKIMCEQINGIASTFVIHDDSTLPEFSVGLLDGNCKSRIINELIN